MPTLALAYNQHEEHYTTSNIASIGLAEQSNNIHNFDTLYKLAIQKKLYAYAIMLGLTVRCSMLSLILFWTIIASVGSNYVIITPAGSMHQLIRAKGPINIPISKYTLDLSLRKSPHNVRRIQKNRSFYFLLGLSLVLPTILITVATSSSFTA